MKTKITAILKTKKSMCIILCSVAIIIVAVIITCCVIHSKKESVSLNSVSSSDVIAETEPETVIQTTEETTIATTAETTQKSTTTAKQDVKENTAKEKSTDKKEPPAKDNSKSNKPYINPVAFLVSGPVPYPTGPGFAVNGLNAGNFREDANGGYLFDVYGTISNKKHSDPVHDDPISGKIDFNVSTMDGKSITSGKIDVGKLQPGESKYGTTTVHVDEKTAYQVHFYTSSMG